MTDHLVLREHLASRLATNWSAFGALRQSRLAEAARPGGGAERIAELIVGDLFTQALDWGVSDLNHQVGYADMLLTRLGIKYLIVETKRPGALAWNEAAVAAALEQATRYAVAQGVRSIAVSDGHLLYAADVVDGGRRGRTFISLAAPDPPDDLWWLSVHGIYRTVEPPPTPGSLLPRPGGPIGVSPDGAPSLLHAHYGLPAWCFAYVGDPSHPTTWHLPYRSADGAADPRRLPKAIQAILTNYRGESLSSVPEAAIPSVLERLAAGARELGHMPDQRADAAELYHLLQDALEQVGRAARSPGPAQFRKP
ncbi:MAG: hypothetical protein EPN50_00595 [Chloroflexota bacterium]|nr:MAG: hypothetical protein EPN50_00595 [Chloroflexota bacterium]